MTTFAQSTIHSKIAKYEKVSAEVGSGRVVKGTLSGFGNFKAKSGQNDPHIMREIEVLPKNKLNIARKMKNRRVIPGPNKNQEIVLMESSLFPAIYFKKTTMRNVLKEFSFPDQCQSLASADDRTPLIYQIVSSLFNEISFFIFNILIGQNLQTNSFYVFFSDSETIPFTKCCNAPVFIELMENGSAKILCNASDCAHPGLAEFLINFEDGRKLWPNITYFSEASNKDKQLKSKISKLILNGKYKKRNLVEMVQQTSKEIVEIFYQSKNKQKIVEDGMNSLNYEEEEDVGEYLQDQNPFLTDTRQKISKKENFQNEENEEDPEYSTVLKEQIKLNDDFQLNDPHEKNIEVLKMKLMYVTKRQKDLNKQMYKGIVESSKVFRSDFDLVKRIDELLLKNRNAKGTTRFNFPRIMSQVKKGERIQKEKEQNSVRSRSLYHSTH